MPGEQPGFFMPGHLRLVAEYKEMNNQNMSKATLSELRKMVGGVKQSVVALEMNVQEPAVSKIEQKQISQLSLDKLQKYVSALGGDLHLSITLPDGTLVVLN